MNFTSTIQSMRVLNVAFDVGSQTLNWSTGPDGRMMDGECENNSSAIDKTLGQLQRLASKHRY